MKSTARRNTKHEYPAVPDGVFRKKGENIDEWVVGIIRWFSLLTQIV